MFKKAVSLFMSIIMTVSFSTVVYAEENSGLNSIENSIVFCDNYSTDFYEMVIVNSGDWVHVITVQNDGKIELASSQIDTDGAVHSLWFSTADLGLSTNTKPSLNDIDFVNSVIDFGKENIKDSTTVKLKKVSSPVSGATMARGGDTDDYDYLISQLEDIYGPEYLFNDWTGVSPEIVDGLTVTYNEWLKYDMTYQDGYEFSTGMSLGSIAAGLISLGLGNVPLAVLSLVLSVPPTATSIMDHNGVLAQYTGSVEYNRYVNINNGGPYFDCFKWIEYRGWVEEGNYYSGVLEEISTKYSYTELVFEDYERQRDLALSNYGR